MPTKPVQKSKSTTTITLDSAAEQAKMNSKTASSPFGAGGPGVFAAQPFPQMPGMPYFHPYYGPLPGGPVAHHPPQAGPDPEARSLSTNLGTMMRLGIDFINSALASGIEMLGGGTGGCSCGGHHQSHQGHGGCGCGEPSCCEPSDDCCSCYGHDRCHPSVHGCRH